uniref:Ig-like domain-containing protein n=1 Tax=Acrobeloides nanus TaxID=290746 RepID=A0A914DGG7_9BILA
APSVCAHCGEKSGTNQEFGFTVLKEKDAASPGFIGTLVVNPKDFDCLKKAHNLGYKFEEFPILVAGVAYKLEDSENSHVQLHITEGTCRVIFHGEDWYLCEAEGLFDKDSHMIRVDVMGKPKIDPINEEVAKRGENVTLQCQFHGDGSFHVRWI